MMKLENKTSAALARGWGNETSRSCTCEAIGSDWRDERRTCHCGTQFKPSRKAQRHCCTACRVKEAKARHRSDTKRGKKLSVVARSDTAAVTRQPKASQWHN